MGHGVRQQANAAFVADPRARDAYQIRRPHRRQRVFRQFHDVEAAAFRHPEVLGKKGELASRGLGHLVGGLLVAGRHVHLGTAGAGRNRVLIAAGDHRARESRLLPFEVKLLAGFAAGQGDGLRLALTAACQHLHSLGNADVHLGGKTVSKIAVGGEPAAA